jgi:hypothetical protein
VSVSVFETNIRVLGSLLSNHMLASDPDLNLMPGYQVPPLLPAPRHGRAACAFSLRGRQHRLHCAGAQGGLLKLAIDVGSRLVRPRARTHSRFARMLDVMGGK